MRRLPSRSRHTVWSVSIAIVALLPVVAHGEVFCGDLPILAELEVMSRCLPLKPIESDVKIYQYPENKDPNSRLKLCIARYAWPVICVEGM